MLFVSHMGSVTITSSESMTTDDDKRRCERLHLFLYIMSSLVTV